MEYIHDGLTEVVEHSVAMLLECMYVCVYLRTRKCVRK